MKPTNCLGLACPKPGAASIRGMPAARRRAHAGWGRAAARGGPAGPRTSEQVAREGVGVLDADRDDQVGLRVRQVGQARVARGHQLHLLALGDVEELLRAGGPPIRVRVCGCVTRNGRHCARAEGAHTARRAGRVAAAVNNPKVRGRACEALALARQARGRAARGRRGKHRARLQHARVAVVRDADAIGRGFLLCGHRATTAGVAQHAQQAVEPRHPAGLRARRPASAARPSHAWGAVHERPHACMRAFACSQAAGHGGCRTARRRSGAPA